MKQQKTFYATKLIVVDSGVMGSNKKTLSTNVAHQIRQKWSEVYDAYKKACEELLPQYLIGKIQPVAVVNEDDEMFEVINMFAQEHYGNDGKQYTSYEAFESCLNKIKERAIRYDLTVAMPYNIGCARGGASWDKIYELLNKYFGAEDQPDLTLYKLN